MRTRVGYTGGAKANPTYHDLGDHTEALQVDYDPQIVSYSDLLQVFWEAHHPTSPAYSAQYKAAIFFHDAEQGRLAVETATRLEAELGRPVTTEILPATRFTRAEDYHQKYRLRRHAEWMRQLAAIYPDPKDFTDSTAAARLNGFLAGFGTEERVRAQVAPLTGR